MNGPLPLILTGELEVGYAEIAGALARTQRTVERLSNKDAWPYREVTGRGGKKRLFSLATLPAPIRAAVIAKRSEQLLSAPVHSAPVIAQPINTLTDQQHAERDARTAVLAAIRRLQANSGCSQAAAMTTLLTTAQVGKLEPALDRLLRLARDPRGRSGQGYPSIRTLKRWLSATDLAPKHSQRDMQVPPWAQALIRLYGQPQKPSLAAVMEQLPAQLPAAIAAPSYHAARRFLDKLGNVERLRGRMLPREIKNLMPFKRRDASSMTPDAIYTADGHKFDAEVSHPRHGKAFRPEITTVLSVPTRRCVGWSAGLAESTWAVMDALRHAVETGGIPMIWYVDNGSGFKNEATQDEVVGFAARLGFSIEHSLPYNSQARGVEERSHKSIWVRGAKKLPTYMGADMDREARQKVFKLTRAHLREAGRSPLLMAWPDFINWCQGEVDAYNARPHRSLPKLRDPVTGKLRHQSPDEAWQAAIDAGWSPSLVSEAEATHLFRPEQIATTNRGEIRLMGNLYFSHELKEHTGERVRVAYDIHNGEKVWVRDMAGRLICVAEFEANKTAYFPQSAIERAALGRAQARERRLETHLQEVREELSPPALLEHELAAFVPMVVPLVPGVTEDRLALAQSVTEAKERLAQVENVTLLPGTSPRPWFNTDPEQYRWLARHPQLWDAEDAAWLLEYAAGEDYADLLPIYAYQGLSWTEQDESRARFVIERKNQTDLEATAE